MATLQDFKTLQASVSSTDQAQIAQLYLTDRDSAVSKMISIAAEKGVSLTSDEVQSFINKMNDDDEFDDLELTATALNSITGGRSSNGAGC